MFDVDDRRAAYREGMARWLAHSPAVAPVIGPLVEIIEGWNDRDRARMRAVLADDLVVEDRRLTGQGRVDGADAYLDTVAVLWDLVPFEESDPRFVLALERHGAVGAVRYVGTLAEGGDYEGYNANVSIVAAGRITRMEIFDIEHADAALARFAELRPDPRSEPNASEANALAIPPNAATRARDRQQLAREARDWDAFADLCAPSLVYDDRRSGVRLTGDRDMALASSRHVRNARKSRTLLATAGDRLALERVAWHQAPGDPAFEIEHLAVCEVDEGGRVVANIQLDLEDRRAASAEMLERFARSGVAPWLGTQLGALRTILEHDVGRLRAALPEDFVFDDHRRVGPGRIEGRDLFIEWMRSLFEQSSDAIVEPLYFLAVEPHAALLVAHSFGTLADGGAFENIFAQIWSPDTVELFELDDLDRARARFEELRASAAGSTS
jgi:hypothetical protein